MRIHPLFILLLSIQGFGQADPYLKIAKLSREIEPKVIAWRRDLHEHPELGNREIRTSALVADHLSRLGIEVHKGVGKTGVVGILRGSQPGAVIALRADMDALPIIERTPVPFASKVKTTYNGQEVGVMHACGHDGHVAILMGVAEVLSAMKKELKGTVKFIFQPAEEGPPKGEEGGAELMIKENVLEDPHVNAIFGLHIKPKTESGKIGYKPGPMKASASDFKIIVKGKSSHGAFPWEGIDPIVVAAQIINGLQTIISRNLNVIENGGVITIGAINGGNRGNIIPEQVEMLGTVRALNKNDEQLLIRRLKQMVTKTSEAMGAESTVTLPFSSSVPVTFNDSNLTAMMLPSMQRAAGKENVIINYPEGGAEDFSWFHQKIPGLYINLGGLPKGKDPDTAAGLHTPDYYMDESTLRTGVTALSELAYDYLRLNNKQK